MDAQKRKLLPRMAKPMLYTIKLHPRFDKNIFSGVVEIRFDVPPYNECTDHWLTKCIAWLLYGRGQSIVFVLTVST